MNYFLKLVNFTFFHATKVIFLLILFLLSCKNTYGQDAEFMKDFEQKLKKNEGKDFHERQALSLDELLLKNNGIRTNSLLKKRNYIVYEYLVTAKRKPYYEGQIFRFKYSDGERYDLELNFIDDSTFTTSYFNNVLNRFENQTFFIKDVKKIYFRPNSKINILKIGTELLTPLGYAAASFLYPSFVDPMQQIKSIGVFYGATLLGKSIVKAVTKSRRLKNNRRVRILKSY